MVSEVLISGVWSFALGEAKHVMRMVRVNGHLLRVAGAREGHGLGPHLRDRLRAGPGHHLRTGALCFCSGACVVPSGHRLKRYLAFFLPAVLGFV